MVYYEARRSLRSDVHMSRPRPSPPSAALQETLTSELAPPTFADRTITATDPRSGPDMPDAVRDVLHPESNNSSGLVRADHDMASPAESHPCDRAAFWSLPRARPASNGVRGRVQSEQAYVL